MTYKLKLIFVGLLLCNTLFSQSKDEVLMTVDGEPILVSEFLRVYNKNLDLVQDESQKDIDGYLKLFTDYQLKLKEARRLELDKQAKYLREFTRYKKQLTQNYLSENKVTDALVREAYDRSNLDINASHILIRLPENQTDTLKTYNDLINLRERVLKEGFDNVKQDVHDGKTIFLEDLGYFSAFKMVYDFENEAYKTPVGEISMPFRTQFGYHVVLVKDKRPSRGTVTAAHIMVALNQKDSSLVPENRIKEIYAKLNQGESFESLAKQFSDDKSSSKNGGKLSAFKSGQLNSIEFEDQAFSLQNDGDYSKPFKTAYGWHIVKRLKLEPIKAFSDLKALLENRVKRDARSKLINSAMVSELKERYQITSNPNAKQDFINTINDDFFKRSWSIPADLEKEKVVFKINNRTFNYGQFGSHLNGAQRTYFNKITPAQEIIETEYAAFFEKSILKYREDNLEFENEDFANILKEYRDGLLLFDLMETEIWNKASKDSVGLLNFYEKNKANYKWGERVDIVMFSSAKKPMVKKTQNLLNKGNSEDQILSILNTDKIQNIIITKGVYDSNDVILPKDLLIAKGVSRIYNHNESHHVIDIKSIIPQGIKSFEEARGMVVNDYQTLLESEWIEDLKSRFKVQIDEDVLNKIKAQIKP